MQVGKCDRCQPSGKHCCFPPRTKPDAHLDACKHHGSFHIDGLAGGGSEKSLETPGVESVFDKREFETTKNEGVTLQVINSYESKQIVSESAGVGVVLEKTEFETHLSEAQEESHAKIVASAHVQESTEMSVIVFHNSNPHIHERGKEKESPTPKEHHHTHLHAD